MSVYGVSVGLDNHIDQLLLLICVTPFVVVGVKPLVDGSSDLTPRRQWLGLIT